MNINTETMTLTAKDLTKEYPRSPRETLAGYVLAARVLDKCRSVIAGFTGINAESFRSFVATGADDVAVAAWITEHAALRPRIEIIKWNNRMRETGLGDMPEELQEALEDYIPKCLPKGRVVYRLLDVFDIEEKRL
jgi:hypothetical protein